MCLATADPEGVPSTRIVLLKDFSEKGLTFFTNYESRKARQIESNPQVAANFLWMPLQRQVNVIGRVERISKAESLKYFLSRPLGSQLGAWTSPQSKVISSRSILEVKLDQFDADSPTAKCRFLIIGAATVSCRSPSSFGRADQTVARPIYLSPFR